MTVPGYYNTIKIKVDKMVSAFYNGQVKKSVSIQFESESEINTPSLTQKRNKARIQINISKRYSIGC